MNREQFLKDFQRFCFKRLGKRNILTAHRLLNDDELLISFLLSSYNCYVIKLHSKRNDFRMITNPNELWSHINYNEQLLCINSLKNMIEDKVKNYDYRSKTTNQKIENG